MVDITSTTTQAPVANAQPSPTGTPVSTEVNSVPQARKPSVENDYAERFARLTSKESQLRKVEQELKEIRAENAKYRALKEQAKTRPESVLSEYGLSYGDLTTRMLEGGTDDKYQTLEQRLAKIEEQDKNKASLEQQRAEQEVYHKAIAHLQDYCDKNADEFEFIKLHNAYDDVLDLAANYYRETGRYMKFDEAARHVEKHLESEAEKLATSKKLQAKFFPKPAEPPAEEKPNLPSRSLSNEGSSSTPTPGEDTLDEKVLMQRAIAVVRNGRM